MDMNGALSVRIVDEEDTGDNVIIGRWCLEHTRDGMMWNKMLLALTVAATPAPMVRTSDHFLGARDDFQTLLTHLESDFKCLHS